MTQTGWIDLHTHTKASDGSMSPSELVRYAKEKGLSAIAITDHDTLDGVEEATREGERVGIEVIAGVEIGVEFKPEMHILGYFLNGGVSKIAATLTVLQKNRQERNPKIVKKLNEMGLEITLDEVTREAGGNVVGRPHFARIMIKKGYVKSMTEAFDRFLASGRPAYFKKDKLTPAEGIAEISQCEGIAVLAHPMYLGAGWNKVDEIIGTLVKDGLKGIEAYYSEHSSDDTGNLLRMAIRHNILVTGGSDYHGNFKPDIDLGTGRGGLKVPYGLLEKLRKA